MNTYKHHVSGFFAEREQAQAALNSLLKLGLPSDRLHCLDAHEPKTETRTHPQSKEVLSDMLTDSAIGVAVGIGAGTLAELALTVTSVSLFVASPLIAPLALLGWGASLGGFLGAAIGAGKAKRSFAELIHDARASGHTVLLAETRSEEESSRAQQLMRQATGSDKDVSTSEG